MEVEFEIIKDIPVDQINKFEDRAIYNVAMLTREYTKSAQAFPYLTGKLQQSEIALPIQNFGNKDYGLGAGVDYATRVWNYKNADWTNPSTQPQWYATILRTNLQTIVSSAVNNALKEV